MVEDFYLKESKHKSKGKVLWYDNGQLVKNFKLTQEQYKEFQEACGHADRLELADARERLTYDVFVRKTGDKVEITVEKRIV